MASRGRPAAGATAIAALARPVGAVDHLVSTASARARGEIGDLERDAVRRSFDTKVIGSLLLARAFRNQRLT